MEISMSVQILFPAKAVSISLVVLLLTKEAFFTQISQGKNNIAEVHNGARQNTTLLLWAQERVENLGEKAFPNISSGCIFQLTCNRRVKRTAQNVTAVDSTTVLGNQSIVVFDNQTTLTNNQTSVVDENVTNETTLGEKTIQSEINRDNISIHDLLLQISSVAESVDALGKRMLVMEKNYTLLFQQLGKKDDQCTSNTNEKEIPDNLWINNQSASLRQGSRKQSTELKFTKGDMLKYLKRISGYFTITGQYNTQTSDPSRGSRVIRSTTGKFPGLWSLAFWFEPYDVMNRQAIVNEAISQWKNGSLVALRWYPCPPTIASESCTGAQIMTRMSYTDWMELVTESSLLNILWKLRLNTMVPYLKQLEAAGVVIIWDPLHLVNFEHWWGGTPGFVGTQKLFRITHDYLTKHHGLNSIIWVWSLLSQDMTLQSKQKYWPGNQYVDVLSLNVHQNDVLSYENYLKIIRMAGDKPISVGMTRTVPAVDILASQRLWVWFIAYDNDLKNYQYNNDRDIITTYRSSIILNRGNIDVLMNINYAQNRPAFASSESGKSFLAGNALDGNKTTRWSSEIPVPQWIYVDLGQLQDIKLVELFWGTAFAKSFQILSSGDSVTWRIVYKEFNGDGGKDSISIPSTLSRYVKMLGLRSDNDCGFSLIEMKVY